MFTGRGTLKLLPRRGEVAVTWDGGALRGDPAAVLAWRQAAQDRDGEAVGPIEGPYTTTDHLASGISATILLDDIFLPGFTLSGDVPERPAIPAGAIG